MSHCPSEWAFLKERKVPSERQEKEERGSAPAKQDAQGNREAQAQDLAALQRLASALRDDRRQAEAALQQASYAAVAAAQTAISLGRAAQDVRSKSE